MRTFTRSKVRGRRCSTSMITITVSDSTSSWVSATSGAPRERICTAIRMPTADRATVAARVLRQLRPEILMTATPKASLLGMLAGALTGVPVRIYQLWGLRSESAAGAQRTALEAG